MGKLSSDHRVGSSGILMPSTPARAVSELEDIVAFGVGFSFLFEFRLGRVENLNLARKIRRDRYLKISHLSAGLSVVMKLVDATGTGKGEGSLLCKLYGFGEYWELVAGTISWSRN